MKEFDLTPKPNPSTLDVRGDIFMAEGGKTPEKSIRSESTVKQRQEKEHGTSMGDTNRATEVWGKYYHSLGKKIKDLPPDERQAVMLAIQEGKLPGMGGGSDLEENDESTAPKNPLQEAIKKIESEKIESDQRKKEIMYLLRNISPHTNSLPKEIIEYAFEFDDTLEYLVNRIVAQPLDAETSNYRLSFYGGINLEQIKDTLKAESETGKGNPDLAIIRKNQYQKVLLISEAVALFHEMNLQIVTGNLEGFVSGSRAITPKQLQVMQNVPGVAQVMRIFDQEYQKTLAQDKYINDENYNKMLGIKRGEKGEITKVKGTIENQVRSLADRKIQLRELENWQVDWAINTGKILFNLTLRAAEQISLGEVQENDRKWASIPQEHAARLMNWLGWNGFRFTIAEARGGVKLAKMASDNYQKNRQIQGYGEMSLEKVGGKDIEDFELAGMFDVSGIWSGWRQNLIILEHAPMKVGGKETTILRYIEGEKEAFEKEKSKELRRKYYGGKEEKDLEKSEVKKLELEVNKLVKKEEPELLRRTFLDEKGEFKKEFNSALGILLKNSLVTPKETDKFIKGLLETKEQIRTAIWKRLAKENPLAVANFLHGAIYKDEEISLTVDGLELWDNLAAKLTLLNEMRMEKINNGEQISLQELIESEKTKENGITLDEPEDELLKKIQLNGKNFAKDFANIRFPFTPFMNDVLFERADYGEAGAAFYQRRAGSDLSSFYSAGNEFVKLMDNPGVASVDDALKILLAVVEAIGSPSGTGTGQDKVAPFLEAYIHFIEGGGQIEGLASGLRRWMAKDSLYSWIMGIARNPNSLAQKYAGPEALSIDEFEIRSLLNKALHNGITRRETKDEDGMIKWVDIDERFRKKYKVKLGWLFSAFFRDMIPLFALAALGDLGQRTARGK